MCTLCHHMGYCHTCYVCIYGPIKLSVIINRRKCLFFLTVLLLFFHYNMACIRLSNRWRTSHTIGVSQLHFKVASMTIFIHNILMRLLYTVLMGEMTIGKVELRG